MPRGRHPRRQAIIAVIALALLAAACSSSEPLAFRDRPNVTRCGTVALPENNPAATGCFRSAVDHNSPAEIHFTNRTIEGDLTESWVQFFTRNSSRLYAHSNDRFGERGWSSCSGPIIDTASGWSVQCQLVKLR